MSRVEVTDREVRIRFSLGEKLGGLLRDQRIPVGAVRGVEVVPDGLRATRGIRAPGLGLPGVRKIGTWRGRGARDVVSVRRGQPAVVIDLEGQRYRRAVIGTDRAEEVAAELGAVVA